MSKTVTQQSRALQQADLYTLLKRPVITEKSTVLAALNQYVFVVDPTANKIELKKAFELAFPGKKVSAVRIVRSPGKAKRRGKSLTVSQELRKAIFTVEGEPLELFNNV